MRLILASALIALLAVTARAAETGTIAATIDKPDKVTAVNAIDRETDKKYPGKVDATTGKLTIAGLPLDKTFDVIVDAGPVRLEGVNLKVQRSDFEEEQPLTKEDREAITKACNLLNQFEDQVEVMTITGNVQYAAAILNKLRTKPFYESKPGEVVWRLELWQFEKPEDHWVKSQDNLWLVLYRQRLQKSEFDKKCLTLDPALGGIKLTEKEPVSNLGAVTLPDNKAGVRLRGGKN
jgi:hypothetical protein